MTALNVYGTNTASSTLSTANTLMTGTGASAVANLTTIGTATGYGELFSQGTSNAWAAAGSIGSPSGHGWLWDVTTLEGKQIISGNWQPIFTLRTAATTATADIYVRAYKYNAGTYTLIGTFSLAGQSFTTTNTTYTFVAASASAMNFTATGDKLYIDAWLNITVASPSSSAKVSVFVANSSTQGDATDAEVITPGYTIITTNKKDVASRFRLMSANQLKDVSTRFLLKSADQLKFISTRFLLRSADQMKDVASRFRQKSADQLKFIATRFLLKSADQLKDIASRFRQKSADQFKDISSRFLQKSADQFKFISTRFLLRSADQLKDISSRLLLKSADQLKFISTRFLLKSADQLKFIASRFRLMSADQLKFIATRFLLKSANQLKDIKTRFNLILVTRTQYYVSISGSDSNNGSQAHPFATIQHAAGIAQAGDTVHVLPGTYDQTTQAPNGYLITSRSGILGAHITFQSEVPWQAKLTATGARARQTTWYNTGNYIDIIGFDITGDGRIGIQNEGSFDTVKGCRVHDIPAIGAGSNGGAGILHTTSSASDNDTIGNLIFNIGYGQPTKYVHGIYHSNARGHIYNNISHNNSGFGIQFWHWATTVIVCNNLVFNNGAGGITIGAEPTDTPPGFIDNMYVANNISIYNRYDYPDPPSSGVVAAGIKEYTANGACGDNNQFVSNCVFGNLNAQLLLKHPGSDVGTILASPQLVNYRSDGNGDYHLMNNSPCVNTGTATNAPSTDFDGKSRPLGAAHDIGPYEYLVSVASTGIGRDGVALATGRDGTTTGRGQ